MTNLDELEARATLVALAGDGVVKTDGCECYTPGDGFHFSEAAALVADELTELHFNTNSCTQKGCTRRKCAKNQMCWLCWQKKNSK